MWGHIGRGGKLASPGRGCRGWQKPPLPRKRSKRLPWYFASCLAGFEIVACVFPWLLVCVPSFLFFFSVLLFFSSCCAICFCFVFLCCLPDPLSDSTATSNQEEEGRKGAERSWCLRWTTTKKKAEKERKEMVFKVSHHQEEESRKGQERGCLLRWATTKKKGAEKEKEGFGV